MVLCLLAVQVGSARTEQSPTSRAVDANVPYRQVLDRYCLSCHNDRLKTAGLSLASVDPARVERDSEVWEKVARKLRSRAMPPAGRPRPDEATYDAFAGAVEGSLDDAAAARPNPGRRVTHRLNRAEYANAVRDLLLVDVDAVDGRALLPPDDTGYGFDNIADVLSVSPMLLERYMSAARKIARLAVGDLTLKPGSQTYTVPKYLRQDDRVSDDLPFGSRAGISVRHSFPVSGEYAVKINLLRTYTDLIRGLAEPHQLQVRLDGKLVQQFTVGGSEDADGNRKSREQLNEDQRMGDARLEARFSADAGPHVVGVSFVKKRVVAEGFLEPQFSVTSYAYAGDTDVLPGISSIVVRGPYNPTALGETPSRQRLFTCRPAAPRDEEPCAKEILSALARRAYRRPLDAGEVQALLAYYKEGRASGSFDAGVQLAVQKVLVSPDFLFRVERDPADARPGTLYRISDLELASRLSFFLWSSIPDDELLDVAARGRLKGAVLEEQVRRLLKDPRSASLVSNFAGQWLQARNIRHALPDPIQYPEFDENLRQAFQRETDLFLENQIREDRSVVELLTADYTFANERLAQHYGIPKVYGNHFRRVALPDVNRRGLLGQGTVLTITSYANRTAPTIRGKWLLENILGEPPPPPPPDVPSLQDEAQGARPRSMRERMEQHRTNTACASCHSRMDPLGFALENFDAVGRWRTTLDGATKIDASGTLPDGTAFDGPAALREALLDRRDDFVRTLTEKLLTYALGRGVEYYDFPAVRRILRATAGDEYRWSGLILELVRSVPFQMRQAG
jgi:mono/diheme cytochrome c family protein